MERELWERPVAAPPLRWTSTKLKRRGLTPADRSGVHDRLGGGVARWAANLIDDGLQYRPVAIELNDAVALVEAVRRLPPPLLGPWPARPPATVPMRPEQIIKRLRIYRRKLNSLAKQGRPPTLGLAEAILRDVVVCHRQAASTGTALPVSALTTRTPIDGVHTTSLMLAKGRNS